MRTFAFLVLGGIFGRHDRFKVVLFASQPQFFFSPLLLLQFCFEQSGLMFLLEIGHFLLGDLLRLALFQFVYSQLQLEFGLRQHSLELISRHDVRHTQYNEEY